MARKLSRVGEQGLRRGQGRCSLGPESYGELSRSSVSWSKGGGQHGWVVTVQYWWPWVDRLSSESSSLLSICR